MSQYTATGDENSSNFWKCLISAQPPSSANDGDYDQIWACIMAVQAAFRGQANTGGHAGCLTVRSQMSGLWRGQRLNGGPFNFGIPILAGVSLRTQSTWYWGRPRSPQIARDWLSSDSGVFKRRVSWPDGRRRWLSVWPTSSDVGQTLSHRLLRCDGHTLHGVKYPYTGVVPILRGRKERNLPGSNEDKRAENRDYHLPDLQRLPFARQRGQRWASCRFVTRCWRGGVS